MARFGYPDGPATQSCWFALFCVERLQVQLTIVSCLWSMSNKMVWFCKLELRFRKICKLIDLNKNKRKQPRVKKLVQKQKWKGRRTAVRLKSAEQAHAQSGKRVWNTSETCSNISHGCSCEHLSTKRLKYFLKNTFIAFWKCVWNHV